jgi:hypothetical protein
MNLEDMVDAVIPEPVTGDSWGKWVFDREKMWLSHQDARSAGVPPCRGTLERSSIGYLSGGCAHLGHYRSAKCRLLRSLDSATWKRTAAGEWTPAAASCSPRPPRCGEAVDYSVAITEAHATSHAILF